MNKFEQFSSDVHNAFELLGGQKSYDAFVGLITASAEQQERERIIKLLEQTNSPSHLWGGIAWTIALIKGGK